MQLITNKTKEIATRLIENIYSTSAWAKTCNDYNCLKWLSLSQHMIDSMLVAEHIWNEFMSDQTKSLIADSIGSEESAELIIFLCGTHDIGKMSPYFECQSLPGREDIIQSIERLTGLNVKRFSSHRQSEHRHELTSYISIYRMLSETMSVDKDTAEKLATCVLGHHGRYQSKMKCHKTVKASQRKTSIEHERMGGTEWSDARKDVLSRFASLIAGVDLNESTIESSTITVMTGGIILSDWIASNSQWFPLLDEGTCRTFDECASRCDDGYEKAHIGRPWKKPQQADACEMINSRFGISSANTIMPNEMQRKCVEVAESASGPMMMIVEASMGSGKTEAALMSAEVLSRKCGSGGVLIALPTTATADGIFMRVKTWCENVSIGDSATIGLLHSKAEFNENLANMSSSVSDADEGNAISSVYVSDWLTGKKAILSDFIVCTIDQLLLMATQTKHYMLRHLGISGKTVIVDEVHSSDAFMDVYLSRALTWLASMNVNVILLSATISIEKRTMLIKSYADGLSAGNSNLEDKIREFSSSDMRFSYPIITSVTCDGDGNASVKFDDVDEHYGNNRDVSVSFVGNEQSTCDLAASLIENGGNIAIIRSTVATAQRTYDEITNDSRFDDIKVTLIHSRYLAADRAYKERDLIKSYGSKSNIEDGTRPTRSIVISTQVIEQSLDVDFDAMISDIAPIDLLLQRIGRIQRHNRKNRPYEPVIYIEGVSFGESDTFSIDDSITRIYHPSTLMKTVALLKGNKSISIPKDIPYLVQSCYLTGPLDANGNRYMNDTLEEFVIIKERDDNKRIEHKREKAALSHVLLPAPQLDVRVASSVSEESATANVRDIDASLSVILLRSNDDGTVSMIDSEHDDNQRVDLRRKQPTSVYKDLARQKINLPYAMSASWIVDATVTALRQRTDIPSLQESRYTKGELVLLLDDKNDVSLTVDDDRGCVKFELHYSSSYGLTYRRCE